uniref:Uncharacterized protein n=1 Tax=Oryza brachyantha TaxID=4533 RepID=J3MDT0_ORYBR
MVYHRMVLDVGICRRLYRTEVQPSSKIRKSKHATKGRHGALMWRLALACHGGERKRKFAFCSACQALRLLVRVRASLPRARRGAPRGMHCDGSASAWFPGERERCSTWSLLPTPLQTHPRLSPTPLAPPVAATAPRSARRPPPSHAALAANSATISRSAHGQRRHRHPALPPRASVDRERKRAAGRERREKKRWGERGGKKEQRGRGRRLMEREGRGAHLKLLWVPF